MTGEDALDRVEQWAEKVLEESARLSPELSQSELREQEARWYADYYALGNEEVSRERLIDQDSLSPEMADMVLAKLRELAAAR
jgi:hypothetical protein